MRRNRSNNRITVALFVLLWRPAVACWRALTQKGRVLSYLDNSQLHHIMATCTKYTPGNLTLKVEKNKNELILVEFIQTDRSYNDNNNNSRTQKIQVYRKSDSVNLLEVSLVKAPKW